MSEYVRKSQEKNVTLSAKQVQALPHLALGQTLADTATAVNVSERTLYRWLSDPHFKETYLELRDTEAQIARVELRGLSLKAATTLSKAMDHENPYISLRAAQTAVKASAKVEDAEDVKKVVRFLSQFAERDDDTITPRESRRFGNQIRRVTRGR